MVALNDSAESLRSKVHHLSDAPENLSPLLKQIGDARFVLIGEASHGTHEFYQFRADLTRRLIREKNFTAVAVEADWPDSWRVNRYVRGFNDDENANEALSSFRRFPQWMWRNTVVLDFVRWLRQHNAGLRATRPKCGFYGMDLYSLHASIEAVLKYLDKVDRAAAVRARYRYSCFDHSHENPQAYGYAASFDLGRSCEDQVVEQLVELRRHATEYAARDSRVEPDEYFYAEQNARLIKNAEEYYRSMFTDRVSSWNVRDRHMVETLDCLVKYLDAHIGNTKLVVWAHNSHIGDARATEMGAAGEFTVGQLVREKWEGENYLIGFTTHSGTVTASTDWDGPAELKRVNPALPDSHEMLFHQIGIPQFLLDLRNADSQTRTLLQPLRLERAIGVIYRPDTERLSHYFNASLLNQFDAIIHLDQTRAVEPLERAPSWHDAEVPETYPTGI
jgi:erythromycin esterase-like protein